MPESFHLETWKNSRNVLMPKSHNFEVWDFLTWMTNLSLGNRISARLLLTCWVYLCVFLPPEYQPFKSTRRQYVLFNYQGTGFWSLTSKSWREMRLCCSLFSCYNNKISLQSTQSANASISRFENAYKFLNLFYFIFYFS